MVLVCFGDRQIVATGIRRVGLILSRMCCAVYITGHLLWELVIC